MPNPNVNLPGYAQAIRNIASEFIAVGVEPEAVASAIANALGDFMADTMPGEGAAALLRVEAGKIERLAPRAPLTATEAELADIARRGHEFVNTLQIAGIAEGVAVIALLHVLVERVVRTSGVPAAAEWLRRSADLVTASADGVTTTAQSH